MSTPRITTRAGRLFAFRSFESGALLEFMHPPVLATISADAITHSREIELWPDRSGLTITANNGVFAYRIVGREPGSSTLYCERTPELEPRDADVAAGKVGPRR